MTIDEVVVIYSYQENKLDLMWKSCMELDDIEHCLNQFGYVYIGEY
jgi:hypothetical protein